MYIYGVYIRFWPTLKIHCLLLLPPLCHNLTNRTTTQALKPQKHNHIEQGKREALSVRLATAAAAAAAEAAAEAAAAIVVGAAAGVAAAAAAAAANVVGAVAAASSQVLPQLQLASLVIGGRQDGQVP